MRWHRNMLTNFSSIPTFVFPVFASYKALKTSDPALLTPWLMYWVVLACALLFESWTGFILYWCVYPIKSGMGRVSANISFFVGFPSIPGSAWASSSTSSSRKRKAPKSYIRSTSTPSYTRMNSLSTTSYPPPTTVPKLLA